MTSLTHVNTPAGECPVKLNGSDRETVVAWATEVRSKGEADAKHYTVNALVYWARRSAIKVDAADVKLWLCDEFNEAALSASQHAMVVSKRNAPKSTDPTKPASNEAAKPERKVFRGMIFGFPVTSVLRWMGKHGISLDEALAAVATLGCGKVSETTVRIQLKAGAKGERGEPAKLTSAQAKAVKAATK